MSIKAMTDVFERQDVKSPTDRFVLVALTDHADNEGHNIYPSVETVSEKTGFERRTVQLSIQRLIKGGFLVLDKAGGGRKRTNRYSYQFAGKGESNTPNKKRRIRNAESDNRPNEERANLTAKKGELDSPEPSVNHQLNTKPLKDKPPSLLWQIAIAVSEATGMSLEVKTTSGIIVKYAKEIQTMRGVPEDVIRLFGRGGAWYKYDWRGQKGDKPKPADIVKEFNNMLEYEQKGKPKAGRSTADERVERRKGLLDG